MMEVKMKLTQNSFVIDDIGIRIIKSVRSIREKPKYVFEMHDPPEYEGNEFTTTIITQELNPIIVTSKNDTIDYKGLFSIHISSGNMQITGEGYIINDPEKDDMDDRIKYYRHFEIRTSSDLLFHTYDI